MDKENMKVMTLKDSLYGNEIKNLDSDAIYCEIQYKRDRSSFAGMAFKIINEKNVIVVRECEEKIVRDVSKYERMYMGCESGYVDCMKEFFSSEHREYGIEIIFLIYSDVRSSQIIFEDLIKSVDKYIDSIRELL